MSYCPITGETHCKCLNAGAPVHAMKVDLKSTLRKLFTDHAVYTAFVLKSIVDKQKDTKVFLTRLLNNQKDIGDQLKPIVGQANGNLITKLLTEHINLAGAVITAATNKDASLQSKIDALFDNSEQVAEALHSLNPTALPLDDVRNMFDTHNQFVIDMTTNRLKHNYQQEQKLFDAYYNEILDMSDAIYNAL